MRAPAGAATRPSPPPSRAPNLPAPTTTPDITTAPAPHPLATAPAPAIATTPPTTPTPAPTNEHADAAYRDLLSRVREEREQLGQLISHPF